MIGRRVKRLVRRGRRHSRRPRRTWTKAELLHYQQHKEVAQTLVHERLEYFNQHYRLHYGRVAIKNTRSRWGSCSSKGNLNFNYRIIFLPAAVQDYLIVHELCHLQELNHGPAFWSLVAETIPAFRQPQRLLREYERQLFVHDKLPV